MGDASEITAAEFDTVLTEVLVYLEDPPPEQSAGDRRFRRLLDALRNHPGPCFENVPEMASKDEARALKLKHALACAALLKRKPAFGERDDGIGPTLGMDLS
ncbi:MAG: hypothetical protein ABIO39_13665 [Caulobacteraceae bacterium]